MITGENVYFSVNTVLALTGIVSIVLAFKLIPDKRSRNLLILAFLLITVVGILMPICLKIYRMAPLASISDTMKRSEGLTQKVARFQDLAMLGYVFEVVAVGVFMSVARKFVSLRAAEQPEAAEKSGEEGQ